MPPAHGQIPPNATHFAERRESGVNLRARVQEIALFRVVVALEIATEDIVAGAESVVDANQVSRTDELGRRVPIENSAVEAIADVVSIRSWQGFQGSHNGGIRPGNTGRKVRGIKSVVTVDAIARYGASAKRNSGQLIACRIHQPGAVLRVGPAIECDRTAHEAKNSGVQQRGRVPDRRAEQADVGGRNRLGLKNLAALIAEEEEGLILDDRAADIAAELMQAQRGFGLASVVIEPFIGIEHRVAMEPVGVAMKRVAARPGRHHDIGAAVPP